MSLEIGSKKIDEKALSVRCSQFARKALPIFETLAGIESPVNPLQ